MEAILYAEVYAICIIIAGVLLYWTLRRNTRSTEEIWLRRMLASFLLNFLSNFLFTLANRILPVSGSRLPLSYLFKTLYFVTLSLGVYCWCGYAETLTGEGVFEKRRFRLKSLILLGIAMAMPVINLWTHWMFDFTEEYVYQRHGLFLVEMVFLLAGSAVCSIRLLSYASHKADPAQAGFVRLTASFPLCILAAIILSFIGEALPVICVCVTVELLCIAIGTLFQQISIDKLTQVNNRQNLLGFMSYKLKNHTDDLYLLMIDLDYFKSINDTYGHLEGDRALVLAAHAIKMACGQFPKRPYIARYGGDEFIVLMEGMKENETCLEARIQEELSKVNKDISRYQLHLSIGCARMEDGMGPLDLIEAADKDLYRIKRGRALREERK